MVKLFHLLAIAALVACTFGEPQALAGDVSHTEVSSSQSSFFLLLVLNVMLPIDLKVEPDFGMDLFEDSGKKKQGKQPKQSPSANGKKPKLPKTSKTSKAPESPKKKVRNLFVSLLTCLSSSNLDLVVVPFVVGSQEGKKSKASAPTPSKSSAPTAAPVPSAGWYLSAEKSSCVTACTDKGLECNAAKLKTATTKDTIKEAAAAVGVTCTKTDEYLSFAAPYISGTECFYPMTILTPKCDEDSVAVQKRLCYCD